jgi:FtsH-binding integral membrane protein
MPWNSSNNSPNTFAPGQTLQPVSQSSVETRMNFIRKTYVLFMAGIVAAIVAGTITVSSRPLFEAALAILRMPLLGLILLIGSVWIASALSRTEGLNYVALFGFTAFCGFWISPLLVMYEQIQPGIVSQAAVLTLLTFGALTTYAFVTKKDFSFLGGMLYVGLITLIGGLLLNAFLFKSASMSYWMSWGILLVFSGYVLFDTSRIIHRYDEKSYCSAAIALFLDFFNMFLAILSILSGGRR